jgi:hypothetical protein
MEGAPREIRKAREDGGWRLEEEEEEGIWNKAGRKKGEGIVGIWDCGKEGVRGAGG